MDDRTRWKRWAGLACLAAVALGILLALSVRQTIHSAVTADTSAPRAAAPVVSTPVLPAPTAGLPAQERDAPLPTAPAAMPQADARAPDEPAPAPVRRERRDDGALAEVRQAILDATPEALVKGKPVKWEGGGTSGYVVPSERQDYEGRVCRNIYATTIDGQDQQEGRARRWCRPIDGDGWAPE